MNSPFFIPERSLFILCAMGVMLRFPILIFGGMAVVAAMSIILIGHVLFGCARIAKTDLNRQILDIRYEDLLTEPETTIRKLCAFLDEEFEPAMLDVSPRTDRVPERERVIHQKLTAPLSTDAIGRWRTTLSSFECFIMEACLQKNLRNWGYPLRFSSLAWRPVLVVAGWMLLGIGPLLAKGIPYLQRRQYLSKSIHI